MSTKLTNWTENIRVCIDCKQEKPLKEFYTNGLYKNGKLIGKQRYRPECKKCNVLRAMKNYTVKPPVERKCIYCGKIMRLVYNKNRGNVCSRKECRYQYNHDYYEKIKNEVFDLLGGKCVQCGFSDRRILQIDHVHGHGNKDYKGFRGMGPSYLLHVLERIKNGSKDYQLLCPNHNWLKRVENKEGGRYL